VTYFENTILIGPWWHHT